LRWDRGGEKRKPGAGEGVGRAEKKGDLRNSRSPWGGVAGRLLDFLGAEPPSCFPELREKKRGGGFAGGGPGGLLPSRRLLFFPGEKNGSGAYGLGGPFVCSILPGGSPLFFFFFFFLPKNRGSPLGRSLPGASQPPPTRGGPFSFPVARNGWAFIPVYCLPGGGGWSFIFMLSGRVGVPPGLRFVLFFPFQGVGRGGQQHAGGARRLE